MTLARLAGPLLVLPLLGACGGSSSETPPPLRPLPPNVHYDRSATTLPGEQGVPEAPDGDAAADAPAQKPAPKSKP